MPPGSICAGVRPSFGTGADRASWSRSTRPVWIIPDNDDAGRAHGDDVARSLSGIAADVRRVDLRDVPAKGDVSDWLDAGHTPDALRAMLRTAEPYAANGPGPLSIGSRTAADLRYGTPPANWPTHS